MRGPAPCVFRYDVRSLISVLTISEWGSRVKNQLVKTAVKYP